MKHIDIDQNNIITEIHTKYKTYWYESIKEDPDCWNAPLYNCEHDILIVLSKDYCEYWIGECSKCKGNFLIYEKRIWDSEFGHNIILAEYIVAVGTTIRDETNENAN